MSATSLREQAPRIATALAAQLLTFEEVPEHFDVSAQDWDMFKFHPYFQRLYRDAKEIWGGEVNSQKRIKLKAQAMLESTLTVLHDLATDGNLHPTNRLDAIKQTARLAGAEQEQAVANAFGPAFHLEINIGTETGVETITLGDAPTNRPARHTEYDDVEQLEFSAPIESDNFDLKANFIDEPTEN